MRSIWFAVFLLGCLLPAAQAGADPCGMVPPISWQPPPTAEINVSSVPIERIGAQKTYVAFSNGIESMVLRPGFKGKVDEFGMLIPFPSPPAIRKVEESVFSHVAAAVDPPEVVVRIRRPPPVIGRVRSSASRSMGGRGTASGGGARFVPKARLAQPSLSFDTVKVVRQEAVGMYDVAVLEAGSTVALKRWMKENQFRYPDGMEEVTQEYVESRWVFVAIKTTVGQKGGVDPRPGMKSVTPNLPSNATFSGHVQAMGFRFEVAEPVVPMRLSAFNPGELRNVVYILSDSPQYIEKIPKRYVVRQVKGRTLARNLTGPLPLRVVNGTEADIPASQRAQVARQRRPGPHNGFAKELFTSDIAAFDRGQLTLEVEEQKKELAAISERLLLTPKLAEALHEQVVAETRREIEAAALEKLKTMTLTIVDGDFDRDVISKHNLAFAPFEMDKAENTGWSYNARTLWKRKSKESKQLTPLEQELLR